MNCSLSLCSLFVSTEQRPIFSSLSYCKQIGFQSSPYLPGECDIFFSYIIEVVNLPSTSCLAQTLYSKDFSLEVGIRVCLFLQQVPH
jgi:hypothetical protein